MAGPGQDETPRRAWRMLVLGVAAQVAGVVLVTLPTVLIPLFRSSYGLSLAHAGLLAGAPTFGMVLALVAWGALADAHGERLVLAGGLALTALCAVGALLSHGFGALGIFLLLGGAASASANAASGRVVMGWFPRRRRGLVMGIRQVAQPLGVTVAAVALPPVAERHGVDAALGVSAAVAGALAAACALGIVDPPRPRPEPAVAHDAPLLPATAPGGADEATPAPARSPAPAVLAARTANPYRSSTFLWRVHGVSALLVVPQYTLATFGLVWLVSRCGMSVHLAGIVLGGSQLAGAAGRIVVGVWSDRLGSRMRLLQRVSVASAMAMLVLAGTDAASWSVLAVAVYVVATCVSVADNGLAYTSVAEAAGPRWAGRALGIQNTAQYVAASAVGPLVGALLGAVAYPVAFALVALAPVASLAVLPRQDVDATA